MRWYTTSGAGPPLVLCHGGPGLWDYLAPLAALCDDVATVVRYDQRKEPPYTVAQFVADLDGLRSDLDYSSWVVGGHSWGATLALHYAFAHPERTHALVYVSGVGIGREWNAVYHAEADRRRTPEQNTRLAELAAMDRDGLEEREFRALTWLPDYAANAEEHVAALADAPNAINREANRTLSNETKSWNEADLAARAAELTMPALIVHGELDPRPHWAIDSLAAALPNATVVKIADVGHLPWIEQPVATAAAIRAFLSLLE